MKQRLQHEWFLQYRFSATCAPRNQKMGTTAKSKVTCSLRFSPRTSTDSFGDIRELSHKSILGHGPGWGRTRSSTVLPLRPGSAERNAISNAILNVQHRSATRKKERQMFRRSISSTRGFVEGLLTLYQYRSLTRCIEHADSIHMLHDSEITFRLLPSNHMAQSKSIVPRTSAAKVYRSLHILPGTINMRNIGKNEISANQHSNCGTDCNFDVADDFYNAVAEEHSLYSEYSGFAALLILSFIGTSFVTLMFGCNNGGYI